MFQYLISISSMGLLTPVASAQAILSFGAIWFCSTRARKSEPLSQYCLRAVRADGQRESSSPGHPDSAFNQGNNLYTEEIFGAIGRMTATAGCRTAVTRQRAA
jgi:hypothetical protein